MLPKSFAVAMSWSSTESLSGTTVLAITPSYMTILSTESITLTVNARYNCAWSSSAPRLLWLVDYTGETKTVTLQSTAFAGYDIMPVSITAMCGIGSFNVNEVTTNVLIQPNPWLGHGCGDGGGGY